MNRPQKALWTKWVVWSGLACFLVTICILYVRYDTAQPQEIIKIYRTVEPTRGETPPSKTGPTAETLERVSAGQQESSETFHNTTLEKGSELGTHEVVSERTPLMSEEHGISGKVRGPETVPERTDAELEHEKWHANMNKLNETMAEKYPDIILLSALSPEEILEIYPTDADLAELQKRAESMQSEFIGQMRSLFSELHPDTQVKVLALTREFLVETYGTEMADRAITDIKDALER